MHLKCNILIHSNKEYIFITKEVNLKILINIYNKVNVAQKKEALHRQF